MEIPSVLCLSGTSVIKDLGALCLICFSQAGKITEPVTTFANPLDYRYQRSALTQFESSRNFLEIFKGAVISQSLVTDKLKPERNFSL